MAEFNVLSKQCPLCRCTSVEPLSRHFSFKAPTHRCSKCGAPLRAVFTLSTLWCIPVGAIALGAGCLALIWLQHADALTGVVRAALVGGIGAFSISIIFNVLLRGVVFRPCST